MPGWLRDFVSLEHQVRIEYGVRFHGSSLKSDFVAFLKEEEFAQQLKLHFLETKDIGKALDAVRMMVVKAVARRH